MSEKLEWVANDWAKPDYQPLPKPEGGYLSIQEQKAWRSQLIEGDPKPLNERDTVSSMRAEGFVGLYRRIE